MRNPKWFRRYLLAAGSAILTLGVVLVFRGYFLHRSLSGLVLGLLFIMYGLFRIKQRRSIPART